jgi:hypothetical protein
VVQYRPPNNHIRAVKPRSKLRNVIHDGQELRRAGGTELGPRVIQEPFARVHAYKHASFSQPPKDTATESARTAA